MRRFVATYTVGYSSVEIPLGFSMITPQFDKVDGSTFTLEDITVCNLDGVELDDKPAGAGQCRGGIYVQKLKDGALIAGSQWQYTTAHYANKESYKDSWGWGKNRTTPLASGEGLIVYNNNSVKRLLRTSGSVVLKPVADIPLGFSLFGNNTPVDYTLADIVVCNLNGVELDDKPAGAGQCRGGIYVQKLKDGALIAGSQWQYSTAHYANKESYKDSWGWGKNRNEPFNAGEALIVYNNNGVVRKFKLPDTINEGEAK